MIANPQNARFFRLKWQKRKMTWRKSPPEKHRLPCRSMAVKVLNSRVARSLLLFAWFFHPLRSSAQDRTLLYNLGDAGVSKAITNWGISVTWPDYHNTRLGLLYLTPDQVDFMHLAFECNQPLTNGDLPAPPKSDLTGQANLANLAGNKPWSMAIGTGAGVDPWYQSGTGTVYPDRWVQAMEAAQR